jgi:adenine specific DNA methylase Mod
VRGTTTAGRAGKVNFGFTEADDHDELVCNHAAQNAAGGCVLSKSSELPANRLYFGDNLDVLREKVKDESVDLVYLDPPFNSDANYNVLFKSAGGNASGAQAEAFRDTWDWSESAMDAYDDVMAANGDVALVLSGFRKWLGENGMMAYLAMMTVRLIELRRVMKPDASIYLHCDPTASHYLKIILDAVFGHQGFRNEIVWQRTSSHNDPKRYGRIHDSILYYSNSEKPIWNEVYEKPDADFFNAHDFEVDENGQHYRKRDLTAPYRGGPSGQYEWKGKMPSKGRMWSYTRDNMLKLEEEGRIVYTRTGMPRLKIPVEELKGLPFQDVWARPELWLNSGAKERIGYPTQKPLALLQRIIAASSNPDSVILDPFCGCGTTVEAAQRMNRQWIGIDVTHYAITLIEARLRAAGEAANTYQVEGRPTTLAGARELARRDKHQFQWWAAWRLGARWYREEKKGADRGIDGRMMFKNGPYGDGMIIISVKGGENIGVKDVRDLRGVIEREGAEMGVIVTLEDPTGPMVSEANAAGNLAKSAHGRLPRLQVVTIADILDDRMPKLPPLPQPDRAVMRAPRKEHRGQLELLLPFAGDKILPALGDFIDPSIMRFG